MSKQVILKFMDGQEMGALMARPFQPSENQIEVDLSGEGPIVAYQLHELSCILLVEQRKSALPPHDPVSIEEVETITGEVYEVLVQGRQKYTNGFFALPTSSDSPYKSLFFPSHGVRVCRKGRPLGKILQEEGLVRDKDIQDVLEEQETLRNRRVGEIIAEQVNLPQETVDKTIEDASQSGKVPKNARVGDILIAAGLVTREQVEEALNSQKVGKKKKVGELLIDRGLITEDGLLGALATKFRLNFVNLKDVQPSEEALKALPRAMVSRMQVFPIEVKGKQLVVATSAPTDPTIGDNLRFSTSYGIELVVARPGEIAAAIRKFYEKTEDSVKAILGEMESELETVEEEVEEQGFSESDSQVINLVNKILIDAYQKGVSDIHFEPGMGKSPFRVRYRIDGECHIAHQISATYKNAIIARVKIMSRLDIAEHRKPQSGKILIKTGKQKVEYRVEITPTVGGQEDAVLRILASSKPLPLNAMGFSPSNLDNFEEILTKPYGIILCVGPTGSGKTTSLHSALGHINKAERKIWTAEDPVEITQAGLRQVQVNAKIGFTFQEALRSFLRADPDVIMVGEMRDPETAKTAIEASLTGHLVFSTLHTNSAPETVIRLIEMGMDPFNFADACLGILAQRLARKLCDECKQPYHPSKKEYDNLVRFYGSAWYESHGMPAYSDELTLMKRGGCRTCGGGGYKGRIAVHELLIGSEQVKAAIKRQGTVEELRDMALEEGMMTLRMDGVQKILQGSTDIDQVMKVCL